ncbi:DUF262 domain-containing protein [Micromonospora sp. L32]|uniref:DUF262 domain-containing protein n=1 Tax=Micromonospora TaxID=1873 RepID=UPI003F8A3571
MEWQDDVQEDDLRDATRKYLPETVVWTTDWTTGALTEQMQREVFDVDPPFQRRSVWNDQKASLYIESLLLGCPVPPITLAELPKSSPGQHQYIVIDGKQRLGTLKRFAIEETLRLTGLQTLPNLNGKGFQEITAIQEFSRFENLPIRTVVMRNWIKDEVLQFVFHRLNSQVTPLSTHELRRSLIAGPFTDYLDVRSARSRGIQRILNISEPDYRLRDAELLLRAIAFSCFFNRYRGNLKSFLDAATRTLNKNWDRRVERELDDLAENIDEAIVATFEIFGRSAFQRIEDGQATGRFNRAVFDMMILTLRDAEVREAALESAAVVRETFMTLSNRSGKFRSWTEATTKSRDAVQGRIDFWAGRLGRALGYENLTEVAESSALEAL